MLVTVGQYINPIDAHIIVGRLEADHIPAFVQHQHHIWAKWTLSLALGYVKVQVHNSHLDSAKSVLSSIEAGDYELEDDYHSPCPRCGFNQSTPVSFMRKIALVIFILYALPIPYQSYYTKCNGCGTKWNQTSIRGYSLWIPVFSTVLALYGLIFLETTMLVFCIYTTVHGICG